MTYPGCLTETGRQNLLQACKIAGISKPCLISEANATVVVYAYNHANDLKTLTEPRYIAFVDIGYSKTTVTLVKFTFEENQIDGTVIL